MSPDLSDIDIFLTTQEHVLDRLAGGLMIVSKQDYEDTKEVLGQFIIVTNFAQEIAEWQAKGDENGEQCLEKTLESLYEKYPKLLDINEQGQGGFGDDIPSFLEDHTGMARDPRILLGKIIAFYYSKQHPESCKASKADNN